MGDNLGFRFGGREFGTSKSELKVFAWTVDGIKHQKTTAHDARTIFAKDEVIPPVWKIELRTKTATEQKARDLIQQFTEKWNTDHLAPGQSIELYYLINNRWRTCYGRPGDLYLPTTDIYALNGRLSVFAEWRCADRFTYDADSTSLVVPIVPASSPGGIVPPVTPPVFWEQEAETTAIHALTVGGDSPAPFTVEVHGPVVNPWVKIGGRRLDFVGEIPWDQSIIVDARARTITWGNDNPNAYGAKSGSAAAMVSPRTRLTDFYLPPGTHQVQFGGLDTTGTATAKLRWRNTWRSL